MPEDVNVQVATEATPALAAAFARLIPQLSKSSPAPTLEQLEAIIASPATDLLLALDDDGGVLGSLTLVVFHIPTGGRAWIEDVVVDDAARGRGVGEALNRYALELAGRKGAKTVDLTSRASREAANRLYRRLGFAQRDTNVYRFSFDE